MNQLIQTRRIARWASALLCAAALYGCASFSTGSHYDETTNFGQYRTFSWVSDTPYITDGSNIRVSPLTQSKIQDAIRSELQDKGYTYVENADEADFVMAYTIGTREQIRVDSYPVEYRGSWGWHVYGSHYYVREYREHSYTRGTLGVDVFDTGTKKPVWHGWAEKTITESDRADPSPAIREGVAALLASFPGR